MSHKIDTGDDAFRGTEGIQNTTRSITPSTMPFVAEN